MKLKASDKGRNLRGEKKNFKGDWTNLLSITLEAMLTKKWRSLN